MRKLWHDYTNNFQRLHFAFAQCFGYDVRSEVVLTGITLYFVPLLSRNAWTVLQCTRNGGNGNTKFPCNIFHRNTSIFDHNSVSLISVFCCFYGKNTHFYKNVDTSQEFIIALLMQTFAHFN